MSRLAILCIPGKAGPEAAEKHLAAGALSRGATVGRFDESIDPSVLAGYDAIAFGFGETADRTAFISLFSRCLPQMKGKKVGILIVGGATVDNVQYDLIKKQFECIAEYLNWNVLFYKPYSANERDELAQDKEAMKEMEQLGKEVK